MAKQTKYTKSARGKECQVRLTPQCAWKETVVLAHLNGAGMGKKHLDIHGAYCCSKCHDIIDGKVQTHLTKEEIELAHLQGVIRTQQIMVEDGVLKL